MNKMQMIIKLHLKHEGLSPNNHDLGNLSSITVARIVYCGKIPSASTVKIIAKKFNMSYKEVYDAFNEQI